jgi:hypothetical protein
MRAILTGVLAFGPAADANRARALVTAAGLEGALRAKVSGLKPSGTLATVTCRFAQAVRPQQPLCFGSRRAETSLAMQPRRWM